MTNDQIDKWAVEHIVLTQGVEATRKAARALLTEAGLDGAPSFKAQQVRLTQPGPGKKITLVLELDAIEPATAYLVTPINSGVVREKSAEQLWREAATTLEMANAELSRAYAELKRKLVRDSSYTRRDVIVPLTEPVSIAKAMLGGREAKAETAIEGQAAAFLVNIQLTPWNSSAQYAAGYAEGFNRGAKAMQDAISAHNESEVASDDPPKPIEKLLAEYAADDCDFDDIEFVRNSAFRYVDTMGDSQVRTLLYTLAKFSESEKFVVPKGWTLVPDFMDAKMVNAWSGGPAVSSDSVALRTSFQEGWKRVLAVAPKYAPECGECKDTGYIPDGNHCMACSEPATAQAIYQVGTRISNGVVWGDVPVGVFHAKKKQNYALLRTVYDMPPTEVKAVRDPNSVSYATIPDAIGYSWVMYQEGRASADHNDKQAFTNTLKSFADWLAARIEVERLKNGG